MEITYQGLREQFRETYRNVEARVRFQSTQMGCLSTMLGLVALGALHHVTLAVGLFGVAGLAWAVGWRARWRRGLARWWIGQRLDARRFPLDQDTIEDCLRLGRLPRRLEQYMDEALQIYADLREFLLDPAWTGSGVQLPSNSLPSEALRTVEANMEALIDLVRVLRRAYDVLQAHGNRFDPDRRRRMSEQYARQSQELGAMIAAFRQAHANLAEAALAASDAQDRARRLRAELEEFAEAMGLLAQGLREAEAVLTPDLAEAEPPPRLTGEVETLEAALRAEE
jgi:hypothetical protein